MASAYQTIFAEWSPPVFLTAMSILGALVYTRGWFAIRRTRPEQFPAWRLAAFLLGVAVIWISIASPLDGFADALLSAHMVEHLLLMSFAPPLLLLGYPVVPVLRGLPRAVTARLLGPLFRMRFLRALGRFLTTPKVAWLVMNLSFLIWHVPRAYDFALEHERWHDFEHICFLGSSILFWWPIIRPWPVTARPLGWHLLPYLVGADVVNTALSAMLAFCGRPVYSYYLDQPNIFHVSPLDDQVAGAVIMWVFGSLVFLVPAVVITVRLLERDTKLRMA
jgi:putative membrane protein